MSREVEKIHSRLVKLLGKKHALVLRGEGNDILNEAIELGVRNILVEVHEDRKVLPDKLLGEVMDLLVDVIKPR